MLSFCCNVSDKNSKKKPILYFLYVCLECVCNVLGSQFKDSNICNHTTGQCPCFPNVIGLSCDECKPNHWKIASGEGCESCNCDPVGSMSEQCNQV